MCGIAGIIGKIDSENVLDNMLKVQKHRGPDYTGKFMDGKIALGHNRLSIIDLTEAANQPFHSTDNRYVLIFNGEIYNYKELKRELKENYAFTTNSDTEVLLASYLKWGEKSLDKLNGMFSFAIWDRKKQSLFASRDRFGVKPFYYTFKNEVFYFASEIKTLFTAGISKIPNEKVWASFFVYGSYGMPNETFWEGINQLPSGHFLTFENKDLEVHKWYDFEARVSKQKTSLSITQVKKNYKELLEDSIKIRFRADVPIGFNVSGGLDSSTLLTFVNLFEDGKNINAYTFYTGDPSYDELPWVEKLIANTKNPLKKVKLEHGQLKNLTWHMSGQQDEPFGGIPTIAYSQLFIQARKDGVVVLFDGQGMDEQWAGYDYYTNKNGHVVQGVGKSPFRPNVLNSEFLKKAVKPVYPKPFVDEVLNLQYRDLFYTKIPRALRFNDRISMAASTELREPFLDYRLVEFAFAQPLDFKIKNGVQKFLLREIVAEHLSESISYAPKRALQTPQREWLANELKEWVNEEIGKISEHQWFNKEQLEKELNDYFAGDRESSFHIWQWLNTSQLLQGT